MDFQYDARTRELRDNLLDFMASHIYPSEEIFHRASDRWVVPGVVR